MIDSPAPSLEKLRERIDTRHSDGVLPLGAPVRSHRLVRRRHWLRPMLTTIGYCAGIAATTAGVLLWTSPKATTVTMTSTSYRLGDTTLHGTGNGQYTGAAALIVAPESAGVQRAAGDAVVSGVEQTGVCSLSVTHSQETCTFSSGGASISAVDTWTATGWSRLYGDGHKITIAAATMIPVPFEVGR